jgi:chorismate dehydratase
VLLKNYWKLSPYLFVGAADYSTSDEKNTAFVQIGDRTFGKKNNYKYAYDLAEEWQNFTGLPFMFAGWIANKPVDADFIADFNNALKFGLDNRTELFKTLPTVDNFDMEDYLMNKIDFNVTEEKKQAMALFLNYIKAI